MPNHFTARGPWGLNDSLPETNLRVIVGERDGGGAYVVVESPGVSGGSERRIFGIPPDKNAFANVDAATTWLAGMVSTLVSLD